MIVINDIVFSTKEDLDAFYDELKRTSYREEYETISDMYYSFLLEVYEADNRLQQMVFDRLGENFISFVILPINEDEILDTFSFQLAAKDESEIKLRDEKVFKELCDICFGGMDSFYARLMDYYS